MRYFAEPRTRPNIKASLMIFWLVALAALAFGGDYGSLPARHFNPSNLARLKVNTPKALTFAVFGDSRNSKAVFERLLKEVAQDPEIAFAIHLGDMVQDGHPEQYPLFFRQVRQNLKKPLLTVVGNHELHKNNQKVYQEIFGPNYYSFQVNHNYFIVVDDAVKDSLNDQQLRWLDKELQKAQAFPRRFVFLHIPLFDPRGGKQQHNLMAANGQRLAELFQQYRVTHIFAGHIHGYFTGEWYGVPFTVSGGAGAEIRKPDPEHYFFHYLKVSVRGDEVRLEVKRLPVQESGGGAHPWFRK